VEALWRFVKDKVKVDLIRDGVGDEFEEEDTEMKEEGPDDSE